MSWRIGLAATAGTLSLFAALQWQADRTVVDVGFWYEKFPLVFDRHNTSKLGGPLTDGEIAAIKDITRVEIEHAFSGLAMTFSENRKAFWSVRVLPSLPALRGQQLPNAGETLQLGLLGGRSSVNFSEVAAAAFAHAPADASRLLIVEGIGRGVGRAAVYELAHLIVGINKVMDNRTDANSYEYFSFNRPSQYYGKLHCAGAEPLVKWNIGLSREAGAL